MKKAALIYFALCIIFPGSLYGEDSAQSIFTSYSTDYLLILSTLPVYKNVTAIEQKLDYKIQNSIDVFGNLYIRYHSFIPSVLTFINNDGSVSVCSSDDKEKVTYVYEYDQNLKQTLGISFNNEIGSLGAFTKDADGNYYFFYAYRTNNRNEENMAVVKYSGEGKKLNVYKLIANAPSSFGGIRVPYDAGTCRMELNGSMLAVYFAREMFNGHQASYGFVLNKDTFERIDRGAATHPDMGDNTQMPYVSHSFNQFILPAENGFIFADHGDAYPRSFTFARFTRGSNTKRLHAFRIPGGIGANATYAEMGGLAKTETGFIFNGTYGVDRNGRRNIFVLLIDENLIKVSAPKYLTKYAQEDGHAGNPKIVSIGSGKFLMLWELFKYSIQAANVIITGAETGYISTFALIVNENGDPVSEVKELKGIRLNINDTLRYNPKNKKAYWAINGSDSSIIVFALDVQSLSE